MAQAAIALEPPIAISPALKLTRGWASPLLSWAADLAVINLAFWLAYWLRYPLGFPNQVPPFDYRPLHDFLPALLSLSLIIAAVLH